MRLALRSRHTRLRVISATFAVGLLLAVAPPAGAVINGLPDGEQHPNVGLIVGLDAAGFGIYSCTGTLVDPVTVLTAAHCVGGEDFGVPVARIVIDFDSHLEQLPSGIYLIARYVEGIGDPNPLFLNKAILPGSGGSAAFLADSAFDVGLLHLVAPASTVFPGIVPVPITGPGTNEQYRTGPGKSLLLQVGWGVKRIGPPGQPGSYYIDFTRNQAQVVPKKATDTLLYYGGNPNNSIGYGAPCSGDSGSPVFRDGMVVGIFTFAQGGCNNQGGGPRIDAGPGRDFLRLRGLVA